MYGDIHPNDHHTRDAYRMLLDEKLRNIGLNPRFRVTRLMAIEELDFVKNL